MSSKPEINTIWDEYNFPVDAKTLYVVWHGRNSQGRIEIINDIFVDLTTYAKMTNGAAGADAIAVKNTPTGHRLAIAWLNLHQDIEQGFHPKGPSGRVSKKLEVY